MFNTRSSKPILTCVLLEARGDRLVVTANNLDRFISLSIDLVQVEQEGRVLLSGNKLRDVVRSSESDTLTIKVNKDEQATILSSDSRYALYTQPAEDFPLPKEDEAETTTVQFEAQALHEMLASVSFAVAREATRYAFNGAMLEMTDSASRCVATDGRRLAACKGPGVDGAGTAKKPTKPILPLSFIKLFEKAVPKDGRVTLKVKASHVMAEASGVTIGSLLVEGQFPPVDDVIPKEASTTITAGLGDLLSAVRRGGLLTTEESKGVRMECTKDGLVIRSRSAESGEAEVRFACRVEGPDLTIGFNPAFIADLARSGVKADEITLGMTAPNRPGLFKLGDNFLYVLMPVSLV